MLLTYYRIQFFRYNIYYTFMGYNYHFCIILLSEFCQVLGNRPYLDYKNVFDSVMCFDVIKHKICFSFSGLRGGGDHPLSSPPPFGSAPVLPSYERQLLQSDTAVTLVVLMPTIDSANSCYTSSRNANNTDSRGRSAEPE